MNAHYLMVNPRQIQCVCYFPYSATFWLQKKKNNNNLVAVYLWPGIVSEPVCVSCKVPRVPCIALVSSCTGAQQIGQWEGGLSQEHSLVARSADCLKPEIAFGNYTLDLHTLVLLYAPVIYQTDRVRAEAS